MHPNDYAQLELIVHSTSNYSIGNSANFKSLSQWNNSSTGNVTSVGSNGDSSYYGLYDMAGQVYEWTETVDSNNSNNRILRGGCYMDVYPQALSKTNKKTFNYKNQIDEGIFGFRVATITNTYNYSNFVTVEDYNNISDDCPVYGYGSVAYNYKISKYLVTNTEYVAFLNNIDENSDKVMELYDPRMTSSPVGGILFLSCNNPGLRYAVKPNMSNKPVVFITWLNAAKYINWLNYNKDCSFDQLIDGTYDLNSESKQRNDLSAFPDLYFLPSENEWYKAAYYNPDNDTYWKYPTQSDSDPLGVLCNSTGLAINVEGYHNSYKKFPIIIVADNQESFIEPPLPIKSGVVPHISLSVLNTNPTPKNNLFLINTTVTGLNIGLQHNYIFTALDSNWPSNIEPLSGSFTPYDDTFNLQSVLKFCPAYKPYSGQNCNYNLPYNLDSNDLNLVKDNLYTNLQIRINTDNYPVVSDNIYISTSINTNESSNASGIPLIKTVSCPSLHVISPSGTPNSISIYDSCVEYIPIFVEINNAIIGKEYTISFTSNDNNVECLPEQSIVAAGMDGYCKVSALVSLNGSKHAIVTAILVNENDMNTSQDSILLKCMKECEENSI
jgi:formylglycine-generating enzyme required for sulfatase activity